MPRYNRDYESDYRTFRPGPRGPRYGSGDYRRPDPFSGWYPGAAFAGAPMFGWGALESGWTWPPYPVPPPRYGADFTPRRPPRESPTYGRGGDRSARRWAERYGYDIEYTIQPRDPGYRFRR